MTSMPRHQCLIYSGHPSDHLMALAGAIRAKLKANYRCLYLNSPAMVAGIRSCLTAQGVDADHEMATGRLLLSSDRDHLVRGRFDPARMLELLREALASALADGHAGLWASGDMSWEFGPEQDFSKLVDYELALEHFLNEEHSLSGVCQYRADTLPEDVVRNGYGLHRALFVNETLSKIISGHVPHQKQRTN